MNSLNSRDVLNAGFFSLTPTVDFFLINLTLFSLGKNYKYVRRYIDMYTRTDYLHPYASIQMTDVYHVQKANICYHL